MTRNQMNLAANLESLLKRIILSTLSSSVGKINKVIAFHFSGYRKLYRSFLDIIIEDWVLPYKSLDCRILVNL
jgi:hypothetical protein